MKTLPIILIILAVIVVAVVVSVIIYAIRRRNAEMGDGSDDLSQASAAEVPVENLLGRTENLERVLALVRQRFEMSVSDVQDMLNLSHGEAAGYLAELAARGDIVQVGKTGRGEVYRVK